jgi:hypothetical protein
MTAEVSQSDATVIQRSRPQHEQTVSGCVAGNIDDGYSSAAVGRGTVSGDDADNVSSDGIHMHRVQNLGPSSDTRSSHSDKSM